MVLAKYNGETGMVKPCSNHYNRAVIPFTNPSTMSTKTLTLNPVKVWMRLATADEQQRLADLAETSRQYLYRIANSDKPYARTVKAELAAGIEAASHILHKESKGRLPKLYRTDMNPTCRGCPYASRCLGERAVASHFDVVQHVGEETGDVA